MYGQNNSSNVRNVQTIVIIAIFLIVPFLVVITSIVGERYNGAVKSDAARQSYYKEIENFHQKRIGSLKREHGWLSLVALDWLNAGKNPIDSIGTAIVKDGRVTVEIDPLVHATLKGVPFHSGVVRTDADTAGADKIVAGSRAFIVIQRSGKFALRMWDANAAARTRFTDIDRYPVSEGWRIAARWVPYAVPKKVSIETVVPGITEEGVVTGAAVFTVDGKEQRLEPIVEEPGADYFFIVSDATNGKETYGGGRFLYAAPPKNDMIVLDFNKMTNPPCAFTPFATCPRPLPGNRLAIRIDAGEKKYGDH